MSSPLAIGAVSAVLRNLLDNGLVEAGAAMGTSVAVSAVAPDTINLENADDPPRLNLFLYRVTPNRGWSNVDLPSRSAVSGERLTNAPLALDLHYMLTAYGTADFQAEILLGYAMHLLHERPVLDRAAIRRALNPSPLDVSMLPPVFQALTASDLADQVELIKITPEAMSIDDLSTLWTAIQTNYRPSSAYQVSVVLIEGTRPAVSPLPVLSRGKRDPVTHRDRGVVVNPDLLPPLPTLFTAETEFPQTGARLDDEVTLSGVRLAGTGHAGAADAPAVHRAFVLAPTAVDATGASVTIRLPNDLAAQSALASGQLSASVRFTPTGETRSARDQCHPAHPGAGAGDCRRCRAWPAGGDRDARRRAAGGDRHHALASAGAPRAERDPAARYHDGRRQAARRCRPILWSSSFPTA